VSGDALPEASPFRAVAHDINNCVTSLKLNMQVSRMAIQEVLDAGTLDEAQREALLRLLDLAGRSSETADRLAQIATRVRTAL
jgi:hypothetical protein